MRRAALGLTAAVLGAACGVKAPPRPPLPEAPVADAGPVAPAAPPSHPDAGTP